MDIYDITLYVGYFLILIGIVAAILLPLIQSMGNPRSLLKTGVAIVALVVIFFIAYSISDSNVADRFATDPFNLTPGTSKLSGGLLITSYFLFIGAFLGIFITEISKMVR